MAVKLAWFGVVCGVYFACAKLYLNCIMMYLTVMSVLYLTVHTVISVLYLTVAMLILCTVLTVPYWTLRLTCSKVVMAGVAQVWPSIVYF